MKYKIKIFLCTVFAGSCLATSAQTLAVNEADSLVQVAYRQVAVRDLLGSVSVVDMPELIDRNYITNSLSDMEGLVGGWNGNSLWGMDGDNARYLVLVDGIPRDADNVQPTEIAQISFMKSAAAVALYGSRAAKGVIYITTKRGQSEGINVNLRANTGFHVAKSFPEFMRSAEYMTYYNEALLNDGMDPRYTDAEIYNYAAGVNPYRYPDVDFYAKEYLRKAYNRTDVTAEIEGGSGSTKFYSNIGYYNQRDQFKFGEAKSGGISRLNFRGNVDMRISERITAFANANATFYDANSGRSNTRISQNPDVYEDWWSASATYRPNRVVPLIPLDLIDPNALAAWDLANNANVFDGKYLLGGTQQDMTNIVADYYAAGRNKYTSRQFQFDTGVNIDLAGLTQGLTFKANYALDYNNTYQTSYQNDYMIYTPTWSSYGGKEMIVALGTENKNSRDGEQKLGNSTRRQTMLLSAQLDYKRTFGDQHNVSGLLVASGWQQTIQQQYHKPSNANLSLNLGYNYGQRYYVDISTALVNSAKLVKGNRMAVSPSVTLGWRLSEENFMKNSSVVDDLMLSVSGSILNQDIDINGYYLHAANWDYTAYGWEWFNVVSLRYLRSMMGSNPDLSMLQRKEISANLRASFFDRMITADVSFFTNSMNGYIIQPLFFPNHLNTGYPEASFVPNMNWNNNSRIGMDFAVNFNKKFGEVDLSLGVTGTWYDTKWTKRDEAYENDYQNRQGRPLDGLWGLKSVGLFQTQAEIDAAPTQSFGGTVRPGDIRYVDQNGDNIIDGRDEIMLGKSGWYGSPLTMGINLTAKWRNFTLFALGIQDYGSVGMKNGEYYWVYGERKYSAVVRDRWTPATAATATYPRLTTEGGQNNFRNSDYWLYKFNSFNLARVQITYDLPDHILGGAFIKGLSVYVSGSNLLTISKERKHLEMNVKSAPQTRFYNLGVRMLF